MPTYVYRRADGSTFEIEQRITEDALETCPTTGQPVTRVISGGTGLIFKGSGFYLTDYSRNKGANGQPPGEKAKTDKAKTSETPAKSESKDSPATSKPSSDD